MSRHEEFLTEDYSFYAAEYGQYAQQTIDFRKPQNAAFCRPVTLTATASSGLPVSYRTSTPGVCRVSGRAVTTRADGTCTRTPERE